MRPSHIAFTFALFAAASTAPAAGADCDRACLTGFVDRYLDALVAHNSAALQVSNKLRFTEDTVDMKLGEGLWKAASKIGTYRQDIIDVRQGVAASQVIVEEAGTPVMLMLRLKVADRRITEVETQVTRKQSEGALFAIDALKTAGSVMSAPPARSQVMSR
jgi:hypothetical protein